MDGDVYFRVASFKEYGKLSKRNLEDLKAGARVEVDERKARPARLRSLEGIEAGRTGLGQPLGTGQAGMAYRVLLPWDSSTWARPSTSTPAART